MSKVLFSNDEQKSNQELAEITEKRNFIANELEAFRLAVKGLIRKDPRKGDVEDFLNLQSRGEVETEAVKRWFQMENINLPIDPSKASAAMTLPKEVSELVESWSTVNGISEKPMKYWSDTKMVFRPVLVSSDEKEVIIERNKNYMPSQKIADICKTMQSQLDVINFANENMIGINSERLSTYYPVLFAYAKPVYSKLVPGNVDRSNPTYHLNLGHFLIRSKQDMRVFDDLN